MDTTSIHMVSSELAHVLKEAFAGAPGPWTYFTDNRAGVGMIAVIDSLTPEEASAKGGPTGSTIAGHVHHVCVSLTLSTALITKKGSARDRTGSWVVTQVSEQDWPRLKQELRTQYDRSLKLMQSRMEWDEESFGAALGAIAHAAYHLGAIRQRLLAAGMLRT